MNEWLQLHFSMIDFVVKESVFSGIQKADSNI